jgi:hypothetical protein
VAKLPVSYPTIKLPVNTAFIQAIIGMFQRVAGVVNQPDFGSTAARPVSQLAVGQTYFDVTLGIPIWWSAGGMWVDAVGVPV